MFCTVLGTETETPKRCYTERHVMAMIAQTLSSRSGRLTPGEIQKHSACIFEKPASRKWDFPAWPFTLLSLSPCSALIKVRDTPGGLPSQVSAAGLPSTFSFLLLRIPPSPIRLAGGLQPNQVPCGTFCGPLGLGACNVPALVCPPGRP